MLLKLFVSVLLTVHPLVPLTTSEHTIPCHQYLNEQQEFNKALQCSAKVLPKLKNRNIPIPNCYIIRTTSPDVQYNNKYQFNYISSFIILADAIVGFYEDTTKTIYVIENRDAPQVYRHELQHYFLDLIEGDGNGRHNHRIWSKCEEAYYTPSDPNSRTI